MRPIDQWHIAGPSGLYSGLVLSLWRRALVRVTAALLSYVFPLLELSDLL